MTKTTHKTSNRAGYLYLIFLGAFLALLGSAFTYFMWLSFQKANHTRGWNETPCEIVTSTVERRQLPGHNTEYSWNVEFKYSVDFTPHVSDLHTLRGVKWSKTEDKPQELLTQYAQGSQAVCFVNPKNTKQAILKHDSRGAGYSIWFPMLFTIGGLGIIISAIKNWLTTPPVENTAQ